MFLCLLFKLFSLKRHFQPLGNFQKPEPGSNPIPGTPGPSPCTTPHLDRLKLLSIILSPPYWLGLGGADQSAAAEGGLEAGFPRCGGNGAAFGAKRARGGGGARVPSGSLGSHRVLGPDLGGQPGSPQLSPPSPAAAGAAAAAEGSVPERRAEWRRRRSGWRMRSCGRRSAITSISWMMR